MTSGAYFKMEKKQKKTEKWAGKRLRPKKKWNVEEKIKVCWAWPMQLTKLERKKNKWAELMGQAHVENRIGPG